MGCWGPKVGDSDQALDSLKQMVMDSTELEYQLKREDFLYYGNMEIVLLAVALVDASLNGFDQKIWSTYITNGETEKNYLSRVMNGEPLYSLIRPALYRLDLLAELNSGWRNPNQKNERQEIIDTLKDRLLKTQREVFDYLEKRRQKTNRIPS